MNFLTSIQADRLISQIREEADPTSPGAKKAFEKLGKLGNGAVPKILEALGAADKRQTVEYVELLSSLISEKTLPLITRGLADSDPRTVSGTAWALSTNKKLQRQPPRGPSRRGRVFEGRDHRGAQRPQGPARTSASCSARSTTCSPVRRPRYSSSSTRS